MPDLGLVAERRVRQQKTLAQKTSTEIGRLWASVDATQIARSWRALIPRALFYLTGAQGLAAADAAGYVDEALAAQGATAPAEGLVMSATFAGVASDGRDLATLLYQPAIRTLVSLQNGQSLARATATGQLNLDMITRTQVADAGRAAELTAIAVRPEVKGYVRMLTPPSCGRCIILAGRVYRWNAGFRRHPMCDCRSIPAAEDNGEDIRTDPKKTFNAMTLAEQERAFGQAAAEAIRTGADINRVVNATRGVYVAGGRKFTREAAGSRPRLMPEQLLIEAKGDRAEAIRLLRLHGYVL